MSPFKKYKHDNVKHMLSILIVKWLAKVYNQCLWDKEFQQLVVDIYWWCMFWRVLILVCGDDIESSIDMGTIGMNFLKGYKVFWFVMWFVSISNTLN